MDPFIIYIIKCKNMKSLYESLFDIDDNVESIDNTTIARWVSEHDIFKNTIKSSDIKKNGDKIDILPKKQVYIQTREDIPFKIGKLNGYLEFRRMDMNADHIVDECGGLFFHYVKGGKKLKNLTIKLNSKYQTNNYWSNFIYITKSTSLLDNMRNVTFDFTDTSETCCLGVSTLNLNHLKNINLINCNTIISDDDIKVNEEDLMKVDNCVKKILFNADDMDNSYCYVRDGENWIHKK